MREFKAKHTPGPWQAADTVSEGEVNGGDIYIYTRQGFRVATIDGRDCYKRAHEYNARLIASAPDLLEALIDLERLVSKQFPEYRESTIASNARSAVAKAIRHET